MQGLEAVEYAANQPAAHECRKVGFTTVPAKLRDDLSWLMLSQHVRQMDDSTLNSLSAFSLAVAKHCYAAANIDTESKVDHNLGQLEMLDFWQTDVLAGLLMQAFMLATRSFESKEPMLQTVSSLAASIKLQGQQMPHASMYVPGLSTVSPGTAWMCVFWNFLRISIGWKHADCSDSSKAATVSLADLKATLSATFAHGQAVQPRAVAAKQRHFWQTDCVASVLFEGLLNYVGSPQADLDKDSIQGWLLSHSKRNTLTQTGSTALTTDAEGADIQRLPSSAPEPVNSSTIHAAISEMSNGFSIVALAKLEFQLLKHFQVSLILQNISDTHASCYVQRKLSSDNLQLCYQDMLSADAAHRLLTASKT